MKSIRWALYALLPTAIVGQAFNYATRFPKSKLYSLEPDTVGLADLDGTIAAFGDFNGDKLY